MQKVFLAVIDMSIVSSLVILAVLLVRALLKRAPRRFAYVLWAAVLLRLLCPFAVESPLSLIPESAGEIAQSAALPEAENVSFVSAASAAYRAIGDTAGGGEDFIRVEVAAPAVVQVGGQEPRQYVSASHGQVWLLLCAWLWPAGTAAVLVWGIAGQIRLRRMLVGAVKLEGEVWLADHIPTAFVMGLVRPRIYLPSVLEGAGRDYVLAHERAHVRRGDHITRLLAFAALALHWFNPLVWLAFAVSGRDMEMSCDEAVMRRSGGDIRADYCQTLLDMSANKHFPSPCLLAFGEGDTGARVRNALKWKKPAFWAVCGAAVIIVAAGVLLLTNQAAKKDIGDGQTVELTFPGYYMMYADSGKVPSPGPFVASMKLPEGWSTRQGTDTDGLPDTHDLRNPAYIYDENGNCAAYAAWGGLTAYDLFYSKPSDADGKEVQDPSARLRAQVGSELTKKTDWEQRSWEEYNNSEDGCTQLISEIYARDVGLTDRRAVCSYSAELEAYVVVEFANGSAYDEAARMIAESIELRAADVNSGGQTVKVSFPGHYTDVNRAGKIWDPGPFVASMELPEGWSVRSGWSEIPEGSNGKGYTPVNFRRDEDDVFVGMISYFAFDPDKPAQVVNAGDGSEAENRRIGFCTELYTQGHWQDFESVEYSDTAETFRASKLYTTYTDKTEIDTRFCIGRYDTELGVYVAIELKDGVNVSESDAELIANSLELSPVILCSEDTYFGFGGYDYSDGIRRGRGAFTVDMKLPNGWSSWFALDGGDPPDAENLPDTHGLLNPGYIYDGNGKCAAFVAWAGFDPNAFPDDTMDRGLSTAVNAALKERTDWARYGWSQLDFSADSGIVYVSQIIDSNGIDTGRRGILVYNRPMEAIVVVEFADGREYDWAARLIAGNIRQLDMPGIYSGSREQELIVPGYYSDGGALVECRAFSARLTLPGSWWLGGAEPDGGVDTCGLRPLAYMYNSAGKYVGFVGWQDLTWAGETQGVRAESEELGAFVCAQFETGAASEEKMGDIARSIKLEPRTVAYVSGFGGVSWGTDEAETREILEYALLDDSEHVNADWVFAGHSCVANYGFGGEDKLNVGCYSFNKDKDKTLDELAALYEELRGELVARFGSALKRNYRQSDHAERPHTIVKPGQSVEGVIENGEGDCRDAWVLSAPDGTSVYMQLDLYEDDGGYLLLRYQFGGEPCF